MISDVLYEVKILNEEGYLYVLAEHQSAIDHLMPFRVLQYIVLIWADHLKKIKQRSDEPRKKGINSKNRKAQSLNVEKNQKLPLVIPMIFYNGKAKYNGPREIKELINAPEHLIDRFLFKPFDLIDTHDLKDEALQEQHWAGVMTFVMKHIQDRELYVLVREMIGMFNNMLDEVNEDDSQNPPFQLIGNILQYILVKGNTQYMDLFIKDIAEGLNDPIIGDKFMSIATQLIEKGISIGVSRANSQAAVQERTEILCDLLKNKFGSISIKYKMLIATASSEELKMWLKNILWAKSIEAVFENETVAI